MRRIEAEIDQKSFSTSYEQAMVNLFYTYSWLNLRFTQFLKTYNISPQQYNLLRILRGQFPKPATVRTLSERMVDRSSNASRLVEKLRIKKFVERKECPNDRRQVDIIITNHGLELLDQIDEQKQSIENLVNSLNQDEAKQLSFLLDKIRS